MVPQKFCTKCGKLIKDEFCPHCQPDKILVSTRILGFFLILISLVGITAAVGLSFFVGISFLTWINTLDNQLIILIMGFILVILFLLVLALSIVVLIFSCINLVLGINLISVGSLLRLYRKRISITVTSVFYYLLAISFGIMAIIDWRDNAEPQFQFLWVFAGLSLFLALMLTISLARAKRLTEKYRNQE